MSIASEELNYLIWRYCQEMGLEVSALALQDETRVLEFDEKYSEHIPLGMLVNLVQKGILYTESELLVRYDGEVAPIDETHYTQDFNLVQALQFDKDKYPELASKGRFELKHAGTEEEKEEEVPKKSLAESEQEVVDLLPTEHFIKTLSEVFKLDKITISSWNPVYPMILAFGEKTSLAKIVSINFSDWSISNSFELRHPFALSSTTGKSTNEISSVSWSQNGEYIVTGVENGELRVWSKDGLLQNVLNFHRSPIVTIKWNPSSSHFLSADVDNVTILWDAQTGTAIQHFELKEHSSSSETLGVDLEWIEETKFVIPGLQGSIVVYQIDESKPLGRLLGHQSAISALEFNHKSRLLLSASDDHTIRVWRGSCINPRNCFYGHSQSIVSAAWLNEDKIISASMDGSVRLWSHELNTMVAVSIVDGVPIFASELSKDNAKLAVGFMDGQVTVYDMKLLLTKLTDSKPHNVPLTIPIYGNYQSSQEGDCVYDLSWNNECNAISVSYSIGEGSIISI